jgi:hypothetical protein
VPRQVLDRRRDDRLDEAAQQHLDVRLSLGAAQRYCLGFGGKIVKDRPRRARAAGLFRALSAPAPTICP